ncbi:2-hydroxychromene-2-carboxylate isomerase [Niveispirillum sp. KHB5.9]|uniref:2-hydroxychromene-2-carboxylate isomerase n=1 Tax=Niveispirillum sp. KHB5.9 TaxID=3400269 RepID=UPI003A851752
MSAAPIDFYFDFASPYAYLAAARIDALAEGWGRPVRWRPILLGAVFKVTSAVPNLNKPLAGDYLRHDVPRCARLWGVPLHQPLPQAFGSLAAARAFYWLDQAGGEHSPAALARAIFHAHWVEGRDMALPENVLDVAASLGLERDAVEAGIAEPGVKDRLRAETDEAITRGVFGAPFFFVDGEPFWGADRMEQMGDWLRRGGW